MAVKTKEELIESIKKIFADGDVTTDESVAFMEDITDTLDARNEDDGENWKAKYIELDKEWKKKYIDRFGGKKEEKEEIEEEEKPDEETIKIKDLFEEKED